MRPTRRLLTTVLIVIATTFAGASLSPCAGQVTGSGSTNFITKWTNGAGSVIGDSNIYSASGLVGIGTTSPAAKLEVNGAAQVDDDLVLGGRILSGSDLVMQILAGGNFSVGLQALNSYAGGGEYNTAVGDGALYSNSTGYYNTACGYQALYSNTTASGNTALGESALYSNTGGLNTAVGGSALYASTTGGQNTAMGVAALGSNTSGGQNSAFGTNALQSSTTGFYNIAIGFYAGAGVTTGSNNIEIGNQGTSSDNGVIYLGTPGTQTSAYVAGIYGTNGQRRAGPGHLQRAARGRFLVPALQRGHPRHGRLQQRVAAPAPGDLPLQEAVRRRVEARPIRPDRRGSGRGLSGSGDPFGRRGGGAAQRTAEATRHDCGPEGADPLA